MADSPNIQGQQDRSRINMSQEHEVRYWSQKFGCTEDELRNAVKAVGSTAAAVEKSLASRVSRA
jgi:hypothetical protein